MIHRPIKAEYIRRTCVIRGVEYEHWDAMPDTEMLRHTTIAEQSDLDQAGNAVREAYGQPRRTR